jgi:putative protease
MTNTSHKVELLAPAGNFEKLEIAVHYGADAVYLAGKAFSLRNFSQNFTLDELQQAVEFARKHDVKAYVACNTYARNHEQAAISDYLNLLGEIGPDALIVADPGIFMTASKIIPKIPIHLSTQANTTNYKSALLWQELGAKRINVARELSLMEIKEIALRCDLEIEAFVHGSMCISYSGRCLLSSFLAQRDSNRGMCAQSCRWKYALVEELRPGHYMPIAENDSGSYIFNSKDLCMIEHIPEMIDSGILSLKIEGRMRGINHLASTVKSYREAIDAYYENPGEYRVQEDWLYQLGSVSNRGYCTGFYFNDPHQTLQNYENIKNNGHVLVGKVLGNTQPSGLKIEVRNKIFNGDILEVLKKKGPATRDRINAIVDENGQPLSFAQPGSKVFIALNDDYSPNDLIRKVHEKDR